jgi:hypothetical protein
MAAVERALGDVRSVVNVGAGAGSYEPADRTLVAIEPSAQMRSQRPSAAAPCLDARAEDLPLPDASVEAAMAIYTDFHWTDPGKGMAELVRISTKRVIVVTVDRLGADRFWLTRDYLPGGNELFRPLPSVISELPGPCEVIPVPIPHDCTDGFVHAFWRRPGHLLDDRVSSTIAMFDRLPAATVSDGLARLRADLDDGSWRTRNGGLCELEELDLGHRLVIWRHPSPTP